MVSLPGYCLHPGYRKSPAQFAEWRTPVSPPPHRFCPLLKGSQSLSSASPRWSALQQPLLGRRRPVVVLVQGLLLFFAKFTRQIFSVKSQIINSLHFANYLWSLLCTVAHSITTGPVSGVGRRKGTGPASMCFLVPLACLVVFTYSCVWFPVPETRTPMQHAVWQPSGVGPRLAFLSTKEASVITRTGYTRSTPQGLQQS